MPDSVFTDLQALQHLEFKRQCTPLPVAALVDADPAHTPQHAAKTVTHLHFQHPLVLHGCQWSIGKHLVLPPQLTNQQCRSRQAQNRQQQHNTPDNPPAFSGRSEEHTSELQSLMRISYAVFCLKKKTNKKTYRNKQHETAPENTTRNNITT